jgi:alkylation response protein AidB-like acyl-CoA dehydrogenase
MSALLQYDDEHALLRDEVRRWLAERCPISETRRISESAGGVEPSLWKELAELGWCGLVIDEAYGGAGLGIAHLAVLMEETGRQLLPAPLLPVALTALLIGKLGDETQRETWLPAIAAGDVTPTLANVEPDAAWRAGETRATVSDGRLHASKCQVLSGQSAGLFCVPARIDGELCIAIVESGADGIRIEPESTLDRTRPSSRVYFENTPLSEHALLRAPAPSIRDALLPAACTAFAAEMVGGTDALLTMTAAYVATREQFGKSIGSFQAIKHPLVDVLVGVEQTRSLVYTAASALDAGAPDAELLARMAKARASDVYPYAASRAVQFHGGYGFTDECDAHLYMKRAQTSRAAFGDARHHRARIAQQIVG